MIVIISLGEAVLPYRTVLMPLLGSLAACRWFVLKSSRAPEWLEHVAKESDIDAANPHQWPESSMEVEASAPIFFYCDR